MKIGIFTDSFRPYKSGVVRSIESFSNRLTSMGHEVYVFGPHYPNCEKEERVFRFISIPAPTQPDFTLPIPISLKLGKTIKDLGIDIIHVQSPFLLGRLGVKFAKRYNIPLVFTYHTMYDQYVHYVPFGASISKKLIQKMGTSFCNQCDLVIAPTGIVEDHLKRLGVKTPVVKISTGIDMEEFHDMNSKWLRENYQYKDDETLLLHVGRMGKEKNIPFLLKAFKEILKEEPGARLIIVGGGPEENTLKTLAKDMELGEYVRFTGMLPRNRVADAYAGADIFVFASLTETQGLVLCEAKTAGIPLVAIKALGAAEMVEDNEDGFLTSNSLEEFVDRVLLLIKDKNLRKRMGERARVNAEFMSSHNQTIKLLEAYNSLLERKRDGFLQNNLNES
ncbi:MAG: glycosyltransferase family 4 protein [Candidatus Syntrophonatronum acetioxidans]|uniref:Glycosyltransferase family 4 protein n=1 Tax=Candidatus Syntrophonatronum acetioxidans TaxID=1795816 RepID=A0A424YI12_9FIRM|nr:MAG: glycosyltransferase family 4 protein [Candidatus Syntrophonatronum acetioxidans]